MLKTRILTGAALTIVFTAVLAFSHIPWFLHIAVAVLSVLAVHELCCATGLQKKRPLYIAGMLIAVLVSFLPRLPIPTVLLVLLIAFIVFGHLMRSVGKQNQIEAAESMMLTLMTAFFFHAMWDVRSMEHGLLILILAILSSVVTDCAAYFVGRRFGKQKLAPVLSPKKTVEGSIGGIVCTVFLLTIIAIILDLTGLIQVHYGALVIYLFLASVIGQFGDLAFSSVKRITGIKDYGKLLPGHGGILDRFDSLLFILPFTYLFCSLWRIFC